MNSFKNVIIALLAGLLVLSLSTQAAQGTTKAPDAVNLINYEACDKSGLDLQIALIQAGSGGGTLNPRAEMTNCKSFLAFKP